MHISLEAIMSDYKEWQRKKAAMNGAIEKYTEERMNDEYGRIHTDGSRSGGQPVLKPCPFCGAQPHHGLSKVMHDGLHGDPYQRFLVWCPKDHAKVDKVNREQAFAAWNTRQPTPSDDYTRGFIAGLDDGAKMDAEEYAFRASQPTQSDAEIIAENKRLREALELCLDELWAPQEGCSCHISPPCGDCVEYQSIREAIAVARAALKEQSK